MNIIEERTEQLKKHLSTLTAQQRTNIRKHVTSAMFTRVMEMVGIFKPPSVGNGPENADGNFCIMRLGEIRGWENHEVLLQTIINFREPSQQEELTEHYQPASIPPEETE